MQLQEKDLFTGHIPVSTRLKPTATVLKEVKPRMAYSNGSLDQRQTQLQALLADDSSFDGDFNDLMDEVTEVTNEIRTQNEQRSQRDEARARLVTNQVRPAVEPDPAEANNGAVENRGGIQQIDVRTALNEFADYAQSYKSGKHAMTFDRAGGRTVNLLDGTLNTRSVLTTDSSTGAGPFTPLVPQPGVIPVNPDRPLRLADLIDRQVTNLPVIEYVRDTTAKGAGNAAEVAENGTKPETVYTFDLVSDTIKTVAHWTNITRAAIADHAQLQGYIQGRLIYGLGYRLDNEIINGDGQGTNLTGIFNISNINIYNPQLATTPYTEARVISIRRGMTPIYDQEYAPNTVALYPDDWQLVELSTDDRGMFRVSPNVQNSLNPRIWGLDVVVTTAVPSGTALVGDFKMGATLWDRQEATIYITDSHASNFVSNVLTLLAEIRVGLAVHRLGAFTGVTFSGNA